MFYEEDTFVTAITGDVGKLYIDISTNKIYRWGGSVYVQLNDFIQQNADWNESNPLSVKFIQNKPTIPPAHKNIINKSMDLWSVGGTPNPMNDNWRGNNTTLNAFNVDLLSTSTSTLLTTSAAQWQRIFANNTTSNYKLNSYLIFANLSPLSDWEFCFVKGNSVLQSSSRVIYFIGDFNQFTQYPTGLIDILPDEVIWMVIRYKGVASVNPSSVFGIANFIFLEQ